MSGCVFVNEKFLDETALIEFLERDCWFEYDEEEPDEELDAIIKEELL